MTTFKLLENRMGELTQAERRAAEYIIAHPQDLHGAASLSQLAEKSGLSNTAIIRLAQKLGYAGFSEFRFALRREMLSPAAGEGASADPVTEQLAVYTRYISRIPSCLDMEQQREIARKIVSARRLCMWGQSRTFLPVQHMSSRLARIGILCTPTDDRVTMYDHADILKEGDLCVIYTLLGRSFQTPELAQKVRKNGGTVVLVTMNPKISIARCADYVVTLPCISIENPEKFYEDQILVYVYNEILLSLISQIYEENMPGEV